MPSSSDEDASDESRSSRWRSADRSRACDAVSDLGFAAAARAAASSSRNLINFSAAAAFFNARAFRFSYRGLLGFMGGGCPAHGLLCNLLTEWPAALD